MRKAYLPAEEALSQAVARDPELMEAWLNLAKTCYEQQKYTRAAECFETAYERSHASNPDRLTLQWKGHYVRALLAAGHPRPALPLIRSLAEQSTGEEQTRWREILLYLSIQLDMRNEALGYATELNRSECTGAKWWKALAHVRVP